VATASRLLGCCCRRTPRHLTAHTLSHPSRAPLCAQGLCARCGRKHRRLQTSVCREAAPPPAAPQPPPPSTCPAACAPRCRPAHAPPLRVQGCCCTLQLPRLRSPLLPLHVHPPAGAKDCCPSGRAVCSIQNKDEQLGTARPPSNQRCTMQSRRGGLPPSHPAGARAAALLALGQRPSRSSAQQRLVAQPRANHLGGLCSHAGRSRRCSRR
jgi:hypothetical protein